MKTLNSFSEEKKKRWAGSVLAEPHRSGLAQIQQRGGAEWHLLNLPVGPFGQRPRAAELISGKHGHPIKS
jgi:hypothetical protein